MCYTGYRSFREGKEEMNTPDIPVLPIGSHVSMSGKEMMLGSVKEALSYGANTFMLYTGAPQNTRRCPSCISKRRRR